MTFTNPKPFNEFFARFMKEQDLEFEIRFGSIQNEHFDSSVDGDKFWNIMRVAKCITPKVIHTNTITKVYNIPKTRMVVRESKTGDKTIIDTKEKLMVYDDIYYEHRMCVSKETVITTVPKDAVMSNTRTKERWSFELDFGSIDLTIVNSETKYNSNKTSYEVEIEITNKKIDNLFVKVNEIVKTILMCKQKNFNIISAQERNYAIETLKTLTKSKYFPGAQPVTLTNEHITSLQSHVFAVTNKADGERSLMLIDKVGAVYFIDNNFKNVIKTDLVSNHHNSVIDGELIMTADKVIFYAFDLLIFDNDDIRGLEQVVLTSRIDTIRRVGKLESKHYSFRVKEYIYGDIFTGGAYLLNNTSEYKTDGLIFIQVDEAYPKTRKWERLYKYKTPENNTIDFFCVRTGSDREYGIWELYVNSENVSKQTHNGVPQKCILFNPIEAQKSSGTETPFISKFKNNLIDSSTNTTYRSHTVIEFYWNTSLKMFQPIRTRWDKTGCDSKAGNFHTVAENIFTSILNPVNPDFLTKYSKVYPRDNFIGMCKKHNTIKYDIYSKAHSSGSLLELCSGCGGDIHKWIKNGLTEVDGYDISNQNISECLRRANSVEKPKDALYKFYNCDIANCEGKLQHSKDTYDNISCQFAVHYFFESQKTFDSLIDIITSKLAYGGKVSMTFMDASKISSLFGGKQSVMYLKNMEPMYYITRDTSDNKKIFGRTLKITLCGNNIVSSGSNEYIVNFEYLVDTLKRHGIECIETGLFENVDTPTKLQEHEKNISSLYRYAIFEKKTQAIKKNPKVIQNTRIVSKIESNANFDKTVNINGIEYTAYKITTTKDIVNIMNTVEFKYTYRIPPAEIVSFDDIVGVFKEIKCELTPTFVEYGSGDNKIVLDGNSILFTNYTYVFEKTTENITFSNWFFLQKMN